MTSRVFSPGDRVGAKANTRWDVDVANDNPDHDIILLAGYYGHVVEGCWHGCNNEKIVHVRWEGVIGGRRWPRIWVGSYWHMYPEEIEHVD